MQATDDPAAPSTPAETMDLSMATLIGQTDWSETPLGPIESWPSSLRTAVGICLGSRFPMFLWWGRSLINLYNDAYIAILGRRHPAALGKPAAELWREVWPLIGPQVDAVIRQRKGSWHERVPLWIERNGYPEETYFTWSHSPVPDDSGGVGGVLCVVMEETQAVRAEQDRARLAAHRQLALDAAQMGWWHYDPRTDLWTFDQRYGEILSVSGTQRPSDEIVRYIHPEDRAGVIAKVKAALDPIHPKSYSAEYRIVRDDGSVRWVEAHGAASCEGDGDSRQVTSFVGTVADITVRRVESDRSRVILESITDAFFAIDRHWRLTYINAQAERILGKRPGELLGNVLWEEYPGLIGTDFEKVYRAAAAHNAPGATTAYYPDHDRWYEVRAYPADDGIAVYFRDVTEERRAQASIRESEHRLRVLIEQSSAGIAQTDLSGRIELANQRFCQIVGYPLEEVLGMRVHDLTHPDDLTLTSRLVANGAATGTEYAMEKRYVRKDGSIVWGAVSASILKDDAGRPQSIMGVVVDITDRKRAEAALRESEERLRLAVSIAQMGTFEIDLISDAVTVNETGREIYGWAPDQVLTFGYVQTHFHPEDRDEVVQRVEQGLRPDGPGEFAVEQRILRTDGQIRWIRVRGRAIFDESADRRAIRCVGTYLDITDQREAEREREQLLLAERAARSDAERASRLKDEFLATVSHELRTPLNAILGYAQVLRYSQLDDDTVYGLQVIERNARAQGQIIEDILDMSRIVSGRLRLNVQRLELRTVVESAVETVRPSANAKNISLVCQIDPLDRAVIGDPARLQQVVWNLLSNAIKFTPAGGRVQIDLRAGDQHVEIAVSDSGQGIRPEFLPHVFEKFRQADASTTRQHAGLGLGLSIVKSLVEMHGGSVTVQSGGENRGTTFTLSLPLLPAEQIADTPSIPLEPAAPLRSSERPSLHGLTILTVDDEPDARDLVRRLLEDCGGRVIAASSAAEAIDILNGERVDVLLSDIGMPDMDGYELLRTVRRRHPDAGGEVPAAALTAFARSEDRTRALRAGFQTHIAKPIEPMELVFAVASLARRTAS